MALNLYRRHRIECEAARPEEVRSGEFEERKKGWKRCVCFIFASGTLARKFRRKNTWQTEWPAAKAVATTWQQAGSWDGEVPQPAPEPPALDTPARVTIERSVKSFLAEFQETAATATQKKYRLLLSKFKEFSTQRGYVMIDQWGPADVREFRSSWPVSPQTAARQITTLKAFLEYCLANEWIDRNPARMVKNPK